MKYNTNFVNRKTVFIEEDIFKRKPNQNDLIEASMKKMKINLNFYTKVRHHCLKKLKQ